MERAIYTDVLEELYSQDCLSFWTSGSCCSFGWTFRHGQADKKAIVNMAKSDGGSKGFYVIWYEDNN